MLQCASNVLLSEAGAMFWLVCTARKNIFIFAVRFTLATKIGPVVGLNMKLLLVYIKYGHSNIFSAEHLFTDFAPQCLDFRAWFDKCLLLWSCHTATKMQCCRKSCLYALQHTLIHFCVFWLCLDNWTYLLLYSEYWSLNEPHTTPKRFLWTCTGFMSVQNSTDQFTIQQTILFFTVFKFHGNRYLTCENKQ